MNGAIVFFLVVVILAVLTQVLPRRASRAVPEYQYGQKRFFLSPAEHEFYDVLVEAVGTRFNVFAQVHLPTIVSYKVRGQSWRGAFRHIDEKSVDFVLCDKAYISPKLAIELDDSSHDRPDRIERDREVERILKCAGLPLLRLPSRIKMTAAELSDQIDRILRPVPSPRQATESRTGGPF